MGEKPVPLDTKNPPTCPGCHKPVFRPGRMVTMMENRENRRDIDESYTVCMHCSAIWRLYREDGALRLSPLTGDERESMWPALAAAVAKFDMNRKIAKRFGMTIEEFMDRLDGLPASVRAKLMDG